MLYTIMNREDASIATTKSKAPMTAIISITDPGSEPNSFHPQPWIKDILSLQFEDVEEGEADCITKEQAKEIAMRQYFEGNSGDIFRNPLYFPNMTCYTYVPAMLEGEMAAVMCSAQSRRKISPHTTYHPPHERRPPPCRDTSSRAKPSRNT